MAQLTTLAAVKAAIGTTTATDAQITNLIASASARIELWLNRKFDVGDWIEWHDGGYFVNARHAPVNSIYRCGYCDGTYFNVQYTGTDPVARVDVTAGLNGTVGTLRLQSIAQPYAVTTNTIALTGTLQDLITSISAVSGWSASFNGEPLLGKASWVPALAGVDATVSQDNSQGPAAVPVAYGEIQIQRVEVESGSIHVVNDGISYISTSFGGVGSGNGFGAGGGFAGFGSNGGDGNHWGNTTGNVPKTFQGVVLDYNGGPLTIPADVSQACIDMVQYLILNGQNSSQLLGGESVGGYSYTTASGASGGKGGPVGGPAGVLAGLDALMKDRLAGWARMALPC
jgi:hypothetical protein